MLSNSKSVLNYPLSPNLEETITRPESLLIVSVNPSVREISDPSLLCPRVS
nr:MAG TPA: hypothetical protein [Bacteriophage sp.]